jgi:peptidoglycan hydrolase CwlO-like protein
MKTKLTLLFIFSIVAVTYTQAQSKKDLEKNYASCVKSRDSLQQLHSSVSNACIQLKTLNTRIESTLSEIRKATRDSIISLRKENADLQVRVDLWKAEFVNRSSVIYDLQQLKDLLDKEIITQNEFQTKKTRLLEKL